MTEDDFGIREISSAEDVSGDEQVSHDIERIRETN